MKQPSYVYIMGNDRPTLYIGVTTKLLSRVHEHKESQVDGFTKQYGLKKLLYFEDHQILASALQREKNLKKWKREWKLELIKKSNPKFKDLFDELVDPRVKPEDDVWDAEKTGDDG